MSTSASGETSPKESAATTAPFEQQVILDLQSQLRQLAQQNRDSIAKALSAAEATISRPFGEDYASSTSTTSSGHQHLKANSHTVAGNNASSPESLITTDIRLLESLPELGGILSDPHPLTLSKSSPSEYPPRRFPADDEDLSGARAFREGSHQKVLVHPVVVDPSSASSDRTGTSTQPDIPYTNPATYPTSKNQLAQQLEDTKARVFHLDSKLKECNDLCEQQKVLFRTAIIDLQTKLNDTIVGRNSVLELRRREGESQERLINQLQKTFADVEASNEQQARVLQDAGCKVSSLQGQLQSCNAALTQINTLVIHHAAKRGRTLVRKVNYSGPADAEQVVNTLTDVLDYAEKESDRMEHKVEKAAKELADAKELFAARWKQNGEEQKEMLQKLKEEQDHQLSAATERALNARKQTLSLQSQLTLTQEQMQRQLDGKTSQVAELQRRLEEQEDEANRTRNALQTKCDTLSSELETLQQQQSVMVKEKSHLHDQIQHLQQQLHDAKESLSKAEESAETLNQQNRQLSSREQESIARLDDLQTQLEGKTNRCEELNRLVAEAREESARQAEQRVLMVQENSKHEIDSLTSDMTSQITNISQRCEALEADLSGRDAALEEALKSREALAGRLAEVQQELGRVAEEKALMGRSLDETKRELEVSRGETERKAASLEERNTELGTVQSINDQLQVQVNERDLQCQRLQEQTSSMAQLAEVTRKTSEDWKLERSQMQQQAEAREKELQDLKLLQDNLGKKLRARERRLRSVEEDNKRLQEAAQGTATESQTAVRRREELSTELQQTKTQMDLVTIEKEKLKADILEKDVNHRREMDKYRGKLQTLQKELHTAHKTIKATAATDGKAVQVAESMQKQVTAKRSEIDALQSEVHWLKECLHTTRKEKSTLGSECDLLKAQVSEMDKNNQNLRREQGAVEDKRVLQSSLVAKLEDALKKAAVKYAECKAVIERQEQDLVRLKLKHKLEMKELQRTFNRSDPSATNLGKPSSRTNTPTKQTEVILSKAYNLPTSGNGRRSDKTRDTEAGATPIGGGPRSAVAHTLGALDTNTRHRPSDSPESVEGLSSITSNVRTMPRSRGTVTGAISAQREALAKIFTDEELQSLLLEMHGVVSSQPVIPKASTSSHFQTQPVSVSSTVASLTSPTVIPRRSQDAVKSNKVETDYRTRSTERQGRTGVMRSPLLTSSPVLDKQPSPRTVDMSVLSSVPGMGDDGLQIIPEPGYASSRPRSPVTSLLGFSAYDADRPDRENISHNNSSLRTGALQLSPFESTGRIRTPDVLDSSVEGSLPGSSLMSFQEVGGEGMMRDQHEQLRLLQEKLEELHQMGGHLQKENRDMASMIKRQDTRIKKCKEQEQQAQRLVKKGR